MAQLTGKIIIKGDITTLTGLHIGGSKTTKKIGEVDNPIIRSANNVPYIPGSSLKGKLRSMLAKKEGTIAISDKEKESEIRDLKQKLVELLVNKLKGEEKSRIEAELAKHDDVDKRLAAIKEKLIGNFEKEIDYINLDKSISDVNELLTDESVPYMYAIFGNSGDNEKKGSISRLLVRDANLNQDAFRDAKFKKDSLDADFTQIKFENTIDRKTGTTKKGGLRQLERIPAGAKFDFELVYDVYSDCNPNDHLKFIQLAMKLLAHDYIGGSGSRGYGKIEFTKAVATKYEIVNDDYRESKDQEYADFLAYNFLES